jgi:hypothetical protein
LGSWRINTLAIKCDKLSDDWNFVPTSLLITFKTSYISRKSAKQMKSYSIFPKSIFAKSPNFSPLQFRNKGAFWETKNIFGKNYPNTLKSAQKRPDSKTIFFLKWSFKHGLHLEKFFSKKIFSKKFEFF